MTEPSAEQAHIDLLVRLNDLVGMCPLSPSEPHTCTTLIAAHDLPILLGLRLPPEQETP